MPHCSVRLLVLGCVWTLLSAVVFTAVPEFAGRMWVGMGAVAVGWAGVLMLATRRRTADEAADDGMPMASLEAELASCMDGFEVQLQAVEMESSQMLGVLAEAVDQLSEGFETLHASVKSLQRTAPMRADDAGACRSVLQDAVAVLDQVLATEATHGHASQTLTVLTEALTTRTAQASALLGEVNAIAKQSGLLALNASIEAARAGAAGREFVLVADEVTALSNRTEEFSAQIATVLGAMQALVGDARAAMDAVKVQNTVGVRDVKTQVEQYLAVPASIDATDSAPPSPVLDAQAAKMVEALQFQDIVAQIVGHVLERVGGMREALAELGGVAHDAALARDAKAVGAVCQRAERIGQSLRALAMHTAKPPVGRGATPGGSIELF